MKRTLRLTNEEAQALLAAGLFAIHAGRLDRDGASARTGEFAAVLSGCLQLAHYLGLNVLDLGVAIEAMEGVDGRSVS